MDRTDRDLLAEISGKIDRMIGLLATQGREKNEQIRVLRKLGFDWKTIGDMTGVNEHAGRMRHSRRSSGET
jgi:hypothetical protein